MELALPLDVIEERGDRVRRDRLGPIVRLPVEPRRAERDVPVVCGHALEVLNEVGDRPIARKTDDDVNVIESDADAAEREALSLRDRKETLAQPFVARGVEERSAIERGPDDVDVEA
jgi:hypothetical protein